MAASGVDPQPSAGAGPERDTVLAVRPGLRLELLPPNLAFLIGERTHYALTDSWGAEAAGLINGARTVGEILRAGSSYLFEVAGFRVLSQLLESGHLVDASCRKPTAAAAFWYEVGVGPEQAQGALATTPACLSVVGSVDVSLLDQALRQAGICLEDDAPMRIVVTDDYLRSDLSAINRSSIQSASPWFLLKQCGTRIFIGPLFTPGQGPCWECLAFWVRNNRPVEELIRRARGENEPVRAPDPSLQIMGQVGAGLAAIAIARAIASREREWSQLIEVDLLSFAIRRHAVVRRPQCASCGDSTLMASTGERHVRLGFVRSSTCTDGGLRRATPRETYARYEHLVSPIVGPVTYVCPVPGRDTELRPVYASGYMVCPRSGVAFDRNCGGKGRTGEQAKVSALCEALERFSGVYQGDEARVRGTRDQLGHAAVSPVELLNFSDAQYRDRKSLNRTISRPPARIPAPFEPDALIDWTPGWSLIHDERRYVPLSYCYAEAPSDGGSAFCPPCGNGVAAGTCLEEAVLHGLLELVERDAVSMWWYSQARRSHVDLAGFCDPYFDTLRDDFARIGWTLWVLDLTNDLGIPVYAALASSGDRDRFAVGFGAHLNAHLAAQRALTELNQLFEPAGQRPAPWDHQRLVKRDYLFPSSDVAELRTEELSAPRSTDLRSEIERCLHPLRDLGLDVIVVDKTRPDIDLNVAHVIVPGLRHIWPRFGPGRLYDIPDRLGWTPGRLTEGELNPVPLYL